MRTKGTKGHGNSRNFMWHPLKRVGTGTWGAGGMGTGWNMNLNKLKALPQKNIAFVSNALPCANSRSWFFMWLTTVINTYTLTRPKVALQDQCGLWWIVDVYSWEATCGEEPKPQDEVHPVFPLQQLIVLGLSFSSNLCRSMHIIRSKQCYNILQDPAWNGIAMKRSSFAPSAMDLHLHMCLLVPGKRIQMEKQK